jgi:putative nucleotidyltransferase with HDIG domain
MSKPLMTQSSLNYLAKQERTRREILHKSDLIPPLPDLVARLLAVLNQRATEPEHIEGLLQHDQVLVAKMLAMVNSPFYGLNRSILTIKEAVMVLGFRGVRSLVLATSTAKFMQRDFSWYGHEPKGLWLHAVCVAAGARQLGRLCSMSADDCEQLFVGGLLHDLGKLLLVSNLHDAPQCLTEGEIAEQERQSVGLDHAEAGALVAAKWNLSTEIQEIIREHHIEGSTSLGTTCVRVADCIAHELGIGYVPGQGTIHEVMSSDLEALGIINEDWCGLRDEVVACMEEAVLTMGKLTR